MPSLEESLASPGPLAAALKAGLESLSGGVSYTFTKYLRLVLPLDGFVFWVRADLVNAQGMQGAGLAGPVPAAATLTVQVKGSLHFATERKQNEDETLGVNRVIFTSEEQVTAFNEISPTVMFVGENDGIRFAFARRGSYFRKADLHHYVGDAVYPALATQIIDSVDALQARQLIVSNSLPLWLAMNDVVPVFPAFLVPDNFAPPYAVVNVVGGSTAALQSMPSYDDDGSHTQLATEAVRVTIYGLRNDQAMDYLDYILQRSMDDDEIGILNMPIVSDEKRTQVEMAVIAIKKTIEFRISYFQNRIRNQVRQRILIVIPSYPEQDTAP